MTTSPIRQSNEFLVFGAPAIEGAEIEELVAAVESGWLGTGPRVARFEDDFRRYVHSSHAMAVASCTAALHLSMIAAGVGPGDEVITTAMTFCATVNAIIHAGATPVLADIEPETMNVDPESLAAAITKNTVAIVPVHFAGRPCDMGRLCTLATKHRLSIIEDCAHAIETTYRGRHAGTFGDFGCFSFYVTKNVVTGEGGMVVCSDEDAAARIKVLALHGMTKDAWCRFGDAGYKHYQVIEAGFKYNMTDMQAALGIHQLGRVEQNWQRRRAVWKAYDSGLADVPVQLPAPPEPETRHAHHLYTILVDDSGSGDARDRFLDAMTSEGIGVGVHYLSIPEHPYYQQRFRWRPEDYPVAMRCGRGTVSLPLSPGLTPRDVEDVVRAVRRAIRA